MLTTEVAACVESMEYEESAHGQREHYGNDEVGASKVGAAAETPSGQSAFSSGFMNILQSSPDPRVCFLIHPHPQSHSTSSQAVRVSEDQDQPTVHLPANAESLSHTHGMALLFCCAIILQKMK